LVTYHCKITGPARSGLEQKEMQYLTAENVSGQIMCAE